MQEQGEIMRTVVLILITTLMIGCTTTKSVMESWEGHYESDLVSSWGAPHSAIDTRDGQRILTWQSYWGQYGQNVCRKSFTIDGQGKITRWSYSGCAF
jgi:hypothetical protein